MTTPFSIRALQETIVEGDGDLTLVKFELTRTDTSEAGIAYIQNNSTVDGLYFHDAGPTVLGSSSATWAAGEAKTYVTMAFRGDTVEEPDDAIILNITSAGTLLPDGSGGSLSGQPSSIQATTIVQDDDGASSADPIINFLFGFDLSQLLNSLSNTQHVVGANNQVTVSSNTGQFQQSTGFNPLNGENSSSSGANGYQQWIDQHGVIWWKTNSGSGLDSNAATSLDHIQEWIDDPNFDPWADSLMGRDLRSTSAGDSLFNPDGTPAVDKVIFEDAQLRFDTGVGGTAGVVYRLYEAAFDRTPDLQGLSHNIRLVDDGQVDLVSLADAFVGSTEFIDRYGENAGNQTLVTALYNNVLDRDPDQAGLDGWVDLLASGQMDAGDVLIGFANSAENISNLAPLIEDGFVIV